MGGESSSTQTTQSSTQPWTEAQPFLKNLLGQLNGETGSASLTPTERSALDQLEQNASAGNPYAGQVNSLAGSLLSGGGATNQSGLVNQAYQTYQNQLSPIANGANLGPNGNPQLQAYLDSIASDVGNNINSQFAAAGRDFSGANQQAYGKGVTQALAPILAQQYNTDVQNQMNAAAQLYGAGNTTANALSGMNQQALTNQLQGVQTASTALDANNYGTNQQLAAEAQRRNIPLSALQMLAQIGVPIAQLGQESTGTKTDTQEMSGAQQFGTIAKGINDLVSPFTSFLKSPGAK